MKISIAVPSYNYGLFLGKCLESIRMQDHNDFEVLIADGGSTDDSLEVIKQFCLLDSRFRLMSSTDKGQSDAIMKVFGDATGDLFCFLNADDCFICSDALSSVVSAFIHYPGADIINFNGYYIDAKGRYVKPVKLRYHPLDTVGLMKYRTAVLQPATFWRRIVHEKVPILTVSHYVFDAIFFYQAYTRFSWLELSKPIAGHRLHGDNKSLEINFTRVRELAKFEEIKFGCYSFRALYLHLISLVVMVFGKIPVIGVFLNKGVYMVVNSLSFLSYYRIPSI
jgi:glycosyltransferase involved in cell wall biosynthesis